MSQMIINVTCKSFVISGIGKLGKNALPLSHL